MKTVMIFGTFDILHYGHFHLFHEARKLGDRVIAVVGRDKNVRYVKGVKPFHNEKERAAILSHINLIDEVVLGDSKDVYKVIRKFRPDIIALGYDQKAYVDGLRIALKELQLPTKIVRLKSFGARKYKTGKIKKFLSRMI